MMFVNKFKKIHHNKQIRIKINLCYLFKKNVFYAEKYSNGLKQVVTRLFFAKNKIFLLKIPIYY